MDEVYNDFLGSVGAGGGNAKSGGIRIDSIDDNVFTIEYDDEIGIDKEALKEEIGEELAKKVEEQVQEILFKNKEENKDSREEIKLMVENMLNEKAAKKPEKSDTQVSFEDALSELEGLDIVGLDEEYKKEKHKNKINKRIKDKEENSLITEYKTDSGTTVIVNTGSQSKGSVSRWKYEFRRIRRIITTGIMVVIFLSLVYLYLNPETAKEVGLMIDTQFVPWFKESILPGLGETLEKTIGEGIDKLLEWAKNQ